MLENTILLTTPTYPYPTLPANESITDATAQRFTKGGEIFTMISHTHCYANHILAQNVNVPSIVLEYPRWKDFTDEVDKGYPVLGISAYPPHLERVKEMCLYVRKRSPATQILLGSYGGMAFRAAYPPETVKKYVDQIVHGEGVRFLRSFLGEPTGRPIRQALMPKAGSAPAYISRYPRGNIGFLVSGLGCIGGCNFCSTTSLFDQKRLQLLSSKELVEHIRLYYDHFPEISQVFVIEEDHFRHPRYLINIREYWKENPEIVERLDWFGFGSVDYIGKFAQKYGWDAIAEIGIGTIFIGVESKFAGEHGYEKRSEVDARVVFDRLHAMGIRTVGAWMCGWDFHHHGNIHEDLNYLISLYPTYQQLTRVSPFPGTPLWEKLQAQDRVREVPWEDVHFWSGAQKNVALEAHETLNFTEYGYDLLHQTWGPSLLRRLDVELSGYSYSMRSSSPLLRRHRSRLFKRHSAILWTNLYALDRFAPNGVVRRRVRKIDEKYRSLLGEPTPTMKVLGRATEVLATLFQAKESFDPMNRHPKEEPYKRYIYSKNGNNGSPIPYRTEMPHQPVSVRAGKLQADMVSSTLAMAMKTARFTLAQKGDPEIDDYLISRLETGWLGLGF